MARVTLQVDAEGGEAERLLGNLDKKLTEVGNKGQRSFNKAAGSSRKFRGDIDLLGRELGVTNTRAGQLLSSLGKFSAPMFAVAGGAAAIGAAAFAAARQLEDMDRSIQVATGASGQALDNLRESARNVFSDVPDSAQLVGDVLGSLNTSMGITGDALEGLSEQVLDVSRIMKEDAAANARLLGDVLEEFNIPASQAGDQLDFLFSLTQQFDVGLNQLLGSTREYGSVLINAGFSMEQSAELFARLESSGINVSRVMPGLNAAFRRWAAENKNTREELQRTITQINNTENAQKRLDIATRAFGAEGAQRLVTAIRNGSFELENLGEGLDDAAGSITQTAEDTETLTEKWSQFVRTVTVTIEPLGRAINEALKDLLDFITEAVDGLDQLAQQIAFAGRGGVSAEIEDAVNAMADLVGESRQLVEVFDPETGGAVIEEPFKAFTARVLEAAEAQDVIRTRSIPALLEAYRQLGGQIDETADKTGGPGGMVDSQEDLIEAVEKATGVVDKFLDKIRENKSATEPMIVVNRAAADATDELRRRGEELDEQLQRTAPSLRSTVTAADQVALALERMGIESDKLRLQKLQQLRADMLTLNSEFALGNVSARVAAEAMEVYAEAMGKGSQETNEATNELQQVSTALTDFASQIITQTRSIGDALRNMAQLIGRSFVELMLAPLKDALDDALTSISSFVKRLPSLIGVGGLGGIGAGVGIGGAIGGVAGAAAGGVGVAGVLGLLGAAGPIAAPIAGGVLVFQGLRKLFSKSVAEKIANEFARDFSVALPQALVDQQLAGLGVAPKLLEDIRKEVTSSPAFLLLGAQVAEATGQTEQFLASLERLGPGFREAFEFGTITGDFSLLNQRFEEFFGSSARLREVFPDLNVLFAESTDGVAKLSEEIARLAEQGATQEEIFLELGPAILGFLEAARSTGAELPGIIADFEALAAETEGLTTRQQELLFAFELLENRPQRVGQALNQMAEDIAFLNSLGATNAQIVELLGEAFDNLVTAAADAGVVLPEAVQALVDWRVESTAAASETVEVADATDELTEAMQRFRDAAAGGVDAGKDLVFQQDELLGRMTAMLNTILNGNDIQEDFNERTRITVEVLREFSSDLVTAATNANRFGFALDEELEALIRFGIAQGVFTEKQIEALSATGLFTDAISMQTEALDDNTESMLQNSAVRAALGRQPLVGGPGFRFPSVADLPGLDPNQRFLLATLFGLGGFQVAEGGGLEPIPGLDTDPQAPPPAVAQTQSGQSSFAGVSVSMPITITGGDPEEITRTLEREVPRIVKQAVRNNTGGVRTTIARA